RVDQSATWLVSGGSGAKDQGADPTAGLAVSRGVPAPRTDFEDDTGLGERVNGRRVAGPRSGAGSGRDPVHRRDCGPRFLQESPGSARAWARAEVSAAAR